MRVVLDRSHLASGTDYKKGRKKESKNTKGFANWRIKGRVVAMDLLSIWRYCKCDNSKN